MEGMTDTHRRFFRENPNHEIKWETVQTEYLKWLEDLARKQLAYNDALQLVSCCKHHDKLVAFLLSLLTISNILFVPFPT